MKYIRFVEDNKSNIYSMNRIAEIQTESDDPFERILFKFILEGGEIYHWMCGKQLSEEFVRWLSSAFGNDLYEINLG